jgi:hypothetical protein
MFVRNAGNIAHFQMTSELQHKTKLMALGPLAPVKCSQITYYFHVHIFVSSKHSLLLRTVKTAVAAISHSL